MSLIEDIAANSTPDMESIEDFRSTIASTSDDGGFVIVKEGGTLLKLGKDLDDSEEIKISVTNRWGDPVTFTNMIGLPDGQLLAEDGTNAFLLEIADNSLHVVEKWALKADFPFSVALAADANGGIKAVAAAKVLLRLDSGGESTTRQDSDDEFWGVAVSPDGSTIVNGRASGTVEVRDAETLEVRQTLEGLNAAMLSSSFSPNGRYLVASDDRARCHLWDLVEGTEKALKPGGKVSQIQWLPDGSGFVTIGLSRFICAYDVNDLDEPAWSFRPEGLGTRYFQAGALSKDGTTIGVLVEDRGLLTVQFGD